MDNTALLDRLGKIPYQNVVSWTTMIVIHAQNGHVERDLNYLITSFMITEYAKMDTLNAPSNCNLMEHNDHRVFTKWIH